MRLHPQERFDAYTAAGWWSEDTWDSLFRAQVSARGDAVAVIDPPNRSRFTDGDPGRWTWVELAAYVDRLAAVLLAHGVGPDDVVGIQLPNIKELAAAYLAIARIGAIASPFPIQYRTYELSQLGAMAQLRAFVTTTRVGDRANAQSVLEVQRAVESLQTIFAWGDPPEGVIRLDDELPAADPARVAKHLETFTPHPNDCITICWTSGTESIPKGVPRTHADWLAYSLGCHDVPGITASDVLLNPFPMVNAGSIAGMLVPWLMSGPVLVQHQTFDLGIFLQQIERERVTYTVAAPAILTQLIMDESLLASADISSLRVVGSGSAPLSTFMITGWEARGVAILNMFGSNEGISIVGEPGNVPEPAMRALYLPRPGADLPWKAGNARYFQAKLIDLETGEQIEEAGRPGELRIAGPTVFAGYLNGASRPSPFDEDGWLKTGDVFEYAGDKCQFLHFVDRANDMIIRGGMKISPAEIESLLQAHPKVFECAVVGYPDQILGERTAVFAVPKPGTTLELAELIEFLKGKGIASFKLPERLVVMEALPRNPLGKILKRDLRELKE